MSTDRIMRIALTAFRRNDALQRCNPLSVLSAVVQASQLGLEISQNGEAFLVPYKNECQLIPGYKGLKKLVLQGGHVTDMYAQEVRERDRFAQTYGLHREFVHEPLCANGFLATDDERGPITGFYAVAVLKNGQRTFVTMSVGRINKIRDASSGYRYAIDNMRPTPWVDDYTAMGIKTVIRALCNQLPMSSELRTAIALDTAANLGVEQSISLQQAADGTYEAPNFAEAYEQQQMAARHQQAAQQQNTAQRASARPSAMPRSAPPAAQQAPVQPPAPAQAPEPSQPRARTTRPAQAPAPAHAPAPAPAKATPPAASPAPAPEPNGVREAIAKMRAAKSQTELNEIFIQAQTIATGRDFEELNYAFDAVSDRLAQGEPDMFPM
jgi:recombination protein RecT